VTEHDIAIFLGGLDFTVHVYLADTRKPLPAEKGSIIEYKTSLKGHENAITDLQVLKTVADEKTGRCEWIVASASKDSYIRLWRLAELLDHTIDN
jgi:WD40 repeat protein